MTYILIAIIILVAIFAKMALVIIPQSETKIVERLGRYYATLQPGINIIIPFIDRAKSIVVLSHGRYMYSTTIDLREQVYDFPKQNVITKDNVQTEINALLYFQIVDPFKATYEINNLPNAIEKLTQTTLRNIIGELELDETLTSRDTINKKLSAVLDDATDKWGVKVNRVELQETSAPRSSPPRDRRLPRSSPLRVRRPLSSTRHRPPRSRPSSRLKDRHRPVSASPRLRPRPLNSSPRLSARALILPTTFWRRNTSR